MADRRLIDRFRRDVLLGDGHHVHVDDNFKLSEKNASNPFTTGNA